MSVFRTEYRQLTPDEAQRVRDIKDTAEQLYALIAQPGGGRCAALASTKLEECVMWAVKGITG
jgi:hypothetical protein